MRINKTINYQNTKLVIKLKPTHLTINQPKATCLFIGAQTINQ